jgi:hypothetical protein
MKSTMNEMLKNDGYRRNIKREATITKFWRNSWECLKAFLGLYLIDKGGIFHT